MFRDIEPVGATEARIADFRISLQHENGGVSIKPQATVKRFDDGKYMPELSVIAPDGTASTLADGQYNTIMNPQLSKTITAHAYAKDIEIFSNKCGFVLSDSFFGMEKGTKIVRVPEGNPQSVKLRCFFVVR